MPQGQANSGIPKLPSIERGSSPRAAAAPAARGSPASTGKARPGHQPSSAGAARAASPPMQPQQGNDSIEAQGATGPTPRTNRTEYDEEGECGGTRMHGHTHAAHAHSALCVCHVSAVSQRLLPCLRVPSVRLCKESHTGTSAHHASCMAHARSTLHTYMPPVPHAPHSNHLTSLRIRGISLG